MQRLRAIAILLLGLVMTPAVSLAEIAFWGYTGIAGPGVNHLDEVRAAGIPTNVASVDFAEDWETTDLGSIISSFQDAGVGAALFLDQILYKKVYVAASRCLDAGGPFRWKLRGNWQRRLERFAEQNGRYIDPATTLFLVVSSEVNNLCLSLADVETGASAVRSRFPGIPTVMGYGFDGSLGQPAPAEIPPSIDWVGFYKYGYYDPATPAHPCNTDGGFLTAFDNLVSKLGPHQRIILVPDGFWAVHLHSHLPSKEGPGTGWPRWYLEHLALRYESFALAQPKVIGMIAFLWPSLQHIGITGTRDLPQALRDRHREIGCRVVGGCQPE